MSVGLSNALAACGLALAAALVARVWRRPAVVHGLWLLVLIKLLTPPILPVPVAWPQTAAPVAEVTPVRDEESVLTNLSLLLDDATNVEGEATSGLAEPEAEPPPPP